MNPTSYLDVICRPHVEAFVADPVSLHKAWAAVVALGQFADYFEADRRLERGGGRKEIQRGFPSFELLADVSNASKHFVLKYGNRRGLSIANLGVGSSAAYSDGAYFSDGSSFAGESDVFRVEFEGKLTDLSHLCSSCLAHLQTIA